MKFTVYTDKPGRMLLLRAGAAEATLIFRTRKGKHGGSCNRSACQAPGAMFYNKSTRAYYCYACAKAINAVNRDDCMRLYGVPDLCEYAEVPHVEA